jgi:hypothetical protein
MWANTCLVVREPEDNRATREHHQRKRSLCGMEPVRAAGDEPDLVVEGLDPSVVDPKADRSQDAVAVLPLCQPPVRQIRLLIR